MIGKALLDWANQRTRKLYNDFDKLRSKTMTKCEVCGATSTLGVNQDSQCPRCARQLYLIAEMQNAALELATEHGFGQADLTDLAADMAREAEYNRRNPT